ncbi:hypothetical protein QAD02_014664 [Eretmocerus hayati]|uniref:Uncharacterized protein n=1 Tax=Eretmocerus hayati TaxID=131215 RepID=A0ACC2P6B3_9HYME|nr:hypothetical protein QAD02_014664 [Eretmocerus hayati]
MYFRIWFLIFLKAILVRAELKTVFEWKYIEFLWDSAEQRDSYIANGGYDHTRILPIDVDKDRGGRVFVTLFPNEGTPATLAIVSEEYSGQRSGPYLYPYPDWSWHERGNCSGLTGVYRIAIDDCNKMYVLDSGYVGHQYKCPAQLVIFDLKTDEMIQRIPIPHDVSHNIRNESRLVTPVLETRGPNCDLANVFMADTVGSGLVILNNNTQPPRLFRLEAEVFNVDEKYSMMSIANETFDLPDSLIGLVVSPQLFPKEGRDLYFRPLASLGLHSANTRVLERSTFGQTIAYRSSPGMLPSQATVMGVTSYGTIIFGLTNELALGCWNRYRDMDPRNLGIIAQDAKRLQFISGLKVLSENRTNGVEEVWILSNRLQKLWSGSMNYDDVNFRVMKSPVDDLIRDTICEPPQTVDPALVITTPYS